MKLLAFLVGFCLISQVLLVPLSTDNVKTPDGESPDEDEDKVIEKADKISQDAPATKISDEGDSLSENQILKDAEKLESSNTEERTPESQEQNIEEHHQTENAQDATIDLESKDKAEQQDDAGADVEENIQEDLQDNGEPQQENNNGQEAPRDNPTNEHIEVLEKEEHVDDSASQDAGTDDQLHKEDEIPEHSHNQNHVEKAAEEVNVEKETADNFDGTVNEEVKQDHQEDISSDDHAAGDGYDDSINEEGKEEKDQPTEETLQRYEDHYNAEEAPDSEPESSEEPLHHSQGGQEETNKDEAVEDTGEEKEKGSEEDVGSDTLDDPEDKLENIDQEYNPNEERQEETYHEEESQKQQEQIQEKREDDDGQYLREDTQYQQDSDIQNQQEEGHSQEEHDTQKIHEEHTEHEKDDNSHLQKEDTHYQEEHENIDQQDQQDHTQYQEEEEEAKFQQDDFKEDTRQQAEEDFEDVKDKAEDYPEEDRDSQQQQSEDIQKDEHDQESQEQQERYEEPDSHAEEERHDEQEKHDEEKKEYKEEEYDHEERYDEQEKHDKQEPYDEQEEHDKQENLDEQESYDEQEKHDDQDRHDEQEERHYQDEEAVILDEQQEMQQEKQEEIYHEEDQEITSESSQEEPKDYEEPLEEVKDQDDDLEDIQPLDDQEKLEEATGSEPPLDDTPHEPETQPDIVLLSEPKQYDTPLPEHPNIIVFLADGIKSQGDIGPRTPNIRNIQAKGATFSTHISGGLTDTTSRAALLTGRLPIRYGLSPDGKPDVIPTLASQSGLPPSEITFAKLLKDSGYTTAFIGKWNLGLSCESLGDLCHHPNEHGFDDFFGMPLVNHHTFPDGTIKEFVIQRPLIAMAAMVLLSVVLKRFLGILAVLVMLLSVLGVFAWSWFCIYHPHIWANAIMRNGELVEQPINFEHMTERMIKEGKRFLNTAKNGDEPFLLVVSWLHVQPQANASKAFQEGNMEREAKLAELDWGVGEVMRAVRKLELDSNLLVYFTTAGAGAQHSPDEEYPDETNFPRVPGFLQWQGVVPPGTIVKQLTSTVDVLPTLVEAAGAKLPADRVYDGVNILPELRGAPIIARTHFCYCADTVYAVLHTYKDGKVFVAHRFPAFWKQTDGSTPYCSLPSSLSPASSRGPSAAEDPDSLTIFDLSSTETASKPILPSDQAYKHLNLHHQFAELIDQHKQSLEAAEDEFSFYKVIWHAYMQPTCENGGYICEDKNNALNDPDF